MSHSDGYGKLYSYGEHNRLDQVSDRDGSGDTVVVTNLYDGRGQRVAKLAGGNTTHFIFGLNGELLGEYEDDQAPVKEYIFLNGQPITVIATETIVTGPNLETIIDNGDPETSSVGSWKTKTNKQPYGVDYQKKNKVNKFYRWTPALTAGSYEVWAWWQSGGSNWSTQVDYTIVHDGITDIETRSHQSSGGQWNLLGTFIYDGLGSEYIEIEAANGVTSADAIKWIELDSAPTQQQVNTYFVHTDHLGTPRVVTNDLQTTIWRWDSTPFGDSTPNENPDGDSNDFTLNLRFPGQYYDTKSGLHYNYFRTYDPSTGRYIESNPIGLRGGVNTYSYAEADPIKYVDPHGLIIIPPEWGDWGIELTCVRMRLLVYMTCKIRSTRCNGQSDSCPELVAKAELALKCASMQEILSQTCYPDSSPFNHKQVIDDALNRAERCLRLYGQKCGPNQCPAP